MQLAERQVPSLEQATARRLNRQRYCAGGKTGLTGIVVVGLTIITAFFSPVIASLSSVALLQLRH